MCVAVAGVTRPEPTCNYRRLAVAVQQNWQLVWRWPDSGNLRGVSRRRSAQALIMRFWDCLALSGFCLGFLGPVWDSLGVSRRAPPQPPALYFRKQSPKAGIGTIICSNSSKGCAK